MPALVTNNSLCQCSFGTAPCPLQVLPAKKVLVSGQPLASIMDNKPMLNLAGFAMCQSPANPAVIAATSAALGVFTPAPCLPLTTAPWTPGQPTLLVGGEPALNSSSMLLCGYGGQITITSPGQTACQS